MRYRIADALIDLIHLFWFYALMAAYTNYGEA